MYERNAEKEGDEGWRYEINYSPLNCNGLFRQDKYIRSIKVQLRGVSTLALISATDDLQHFIYFTSGNRALKDAGGTMGQFTPVVQENNVSGRKKNLAVQTFKYRN
jgi:hypothetical protein